MNRYSGLIFAALLLTVQVQADGGKGGDGCFQMYLPGAAFPVICVSGSIEEGIGGSNAIVGLIHAGSVVWCGKTLGTQDHGSDDKTNKRTYTFNKKTGMLSIEFN